MLSSSIAKSCAWLIAWGITLTGTLSIANLPGNWGNSVCGAWGCGPPLQALLACHASWLVVLVPMAVVASRTLNAQSVRRGSIIGLAIATTGALVFALHDYFTWYAEASEWQRSYYAHRVGFSILTTVETPVFEIAGISAVQLFGLKRRVRRSQEAVSADVRMAKTEHGISTVRVK